MYTLTKDERISLDVDGPKDHPRVEKPDFRFYDRAIPEIFISRVSFLHKKCIAFHHES